MQASTLQPTLENTFVETTQDALLIVSACRESLLGNKRNNSTFPIAFRRPQQDERTTLIRSGNVFVFNETTSGIRRWTDGYAWSPSRILGNFLAYRQLDTKAPTGRRRKSPKKDSVHAVSSSTALFGPKNEFEPGLRHPQDWQSRNNLQFRDESECQKTAEIERRLLGSLTDTYDFKPDGLMKKTISLTIEDCVCHLVSYYNPQDVLDGKFLSPSFNMRMFRNVVIQHDLMSGQNFRIDPQLERFEHYLRSPPSKSETGQIRQQAFQNESPETQPNGFPERESKYLYGGRLAKPNPNHNHNAYGMNANSDLCNTRRFSHAPHLSSSPHCFASGTSTESLTSDSSSGTSSSASDSMPRASPQVPLSYMVPRRSLPCVNALPPAPYRDEYNRMRMTSSAMEKIDNSDSRHSAGISARHSFTEDYNAYHNSPYPVWQRPAQQLEESFAWQEMPKMVQSYSDIMQDSPADIDAPNDFTSSLTPYMWEKDPGLFLDISSPHASQMTNEDLAEELRRMNCQLPMFRNAYCSRSPFPENQQKHPWITHSLGPFHEE